MFTGTYMLVEGAEVGVPLVAAALVLAIALVAGAGAAAAWTVIKRKWGDGSQAYEWRGADRTLVESTEDAVLLVDRDGILLNANSAARGMLEQADLRGKNIAQVVGDTLFTR